MALFDIKNKVVLKDIEFNEIRMSDRKIFEKKLNECEYDSTMWFNNFSYLHSFDESDNRKVLWKEIDNMICVFHYSKQNKIYLMFLPLGKGKSKKVAKVLKKAFDIVSLVNDEKLKSVEMWNMNSNQIDFIGDEFKLTGGTSNCEYHYDAERIRSLAGSDLAYIRRKINKFNKKYPTAIFREYKDKDWDQIIMLQKAWADTSGEKYFRILDNTYYRSVIKHREELDHKVYVVELHGRIIGATSGQYTSPDHKKAYCFIRKPLNNFEGLSEYLIYKLACELSEAEIINDGSDGGEDGLKFFKQRFPSKEVVSIHGCKLKNAK